jgi:hypothetical protein
VFPGAFTKDGKLAVDYYDRQYGKPTGSAKVPEDEDGASDILVGSMTRKFGTDQVTSSSMPTPTQPRMRTVPASSTATTSGWTRRATTR